MKACIYCGKKKPLTEYHKKASNKDGRDNRCKDCMLKYQNGKIKPKARKARIEKSTYSMTAWTPRLKRIKDCYLTENGGEYSLHINGGQPLPASDIEIVLWKRIQVLEKRLEMIGG